MTAELALIFVKPIVALVLAVGFTVAHDSSGIQGALVGFMILAAAAVAWPVVAHMFTFFEGQFAIGGVAAAFGAAEGAAGRFGGGGRSIGSQPMWQSMEQAASRSGGIPGSSAWDPPAARSTSPRRRAPPRRWPPKAWRSRGHRRQRAVSRRRGRRRGRADRRWPCWPASKGSTRRSAPPAGSSGRVGDMAGIDGGSAADSQGSWAAAGVRRPPNAAGPARPGA